MAWASTEVGEEAPSWLQQPLLRQLLLHRQNMEEVVIGELKPQEGEGEPS